LPPKEIIERRVNETKANDVKGFIPLVQAVARELGDEAYLMRQSLSIAERAWQ
jgi:hypothetical protein